MSFALYIPVGPDQRHIERGADVFHSVIHYSHDLRWAVFVDDSTEDRHLAARLPAPRGCNTIILKNPRRGGGFGTLGGLCVADLLAFEYIHRHTTASFALKLDTDSLVIAPFETQIQEALARNRAGGLFGVIGDSCGENRRYSCIEHNRRWYEQVCTLSSSMSELSADELAVIRRSGIRSEAQFDNLLKVKTYIISASQHGYKLGEYCQGGGYAVSRLLLESMAEARHFADPLMWLDIMLGEDVMMGLLCGAVGLKLYDLSGYGQPFAVQPGCTSYSRQDLLRMKCSIIHSIQGSLEDEVRAFFRERRKECWELNSSA